VSKAKGELFKKLEEIKKAEEYIKKEKERLLSKAQSKPEPPKPTPPTSDLVNISVNYFQLGYLIGLIEAEMENMEGNPDYEFLIDQLYSLKQRLIVGLSRYDEEVE